MSKEKEIVPEETDMIDRIWVPGCACSDACGAEGEDQVDITFEIPGTKKEDIDLKVIPDGLRLTAKRDKNTEYVSEYEFMCPADVEHVKADYHEGVLDVTIPMTCKDPFMDSKRIVVV